MVQNCCSRCMSCVGRAVCFVFCCTCCCRKKEQKTEETQQNIELHDTSRPQTIFEDDGSIYNGSSLYDSQPVIKRQLFSESETSGVYMSKSSLYSGSVIENPNELKLDFSCEIKGTVEVGGIPQPVKGILSIVPDDNNARQLPDTPIHAVNPNLSNNVPLRHKSSRTDSLKKQPSKSIYSKTPQPLPRVQAPPKNRASEMYFYKRSSKMNEEKDTISEADNENCYSEPKPPIPVKQRNTQDPTKSYIPVYENFTWETKKTASTYGDTQQETKLKFTEQDIPTAKNDDEDHIYEDVSPNYNGPYSCRSTLKADDYEIYMA